MHEAEGLVLVQVLVQGLLVWQTVLALPSSGCLDCPLAASSRSLRQTSLPACATIADSYRSLAACSHASPKRLCRGMGLADQGHYSRL